MTLHTHIRTTLANTSALHPMDTATIAKGHTLRATKAALADLLDKFKVCHCRITINGKTVDYWWLAGNIEGSPNLPQTINYNNVQQKRRAAAARAAK